MRISRISTDAARKGASDQRKRPKHFSYVAGRQASINNNSNDDDENERRNAAVNAWAGKARALAYLQA